jgi:hypothetical protein
MRDLKRPAKDNGPHPRPAEECNIGFLPESLVKQCRNVIESYHGSHGYFACPIYCGSLVLALSSNGTRRSAPCLERHPLPGAQRKPTSASSR